MKKILFMALIAASLFACSDNGIGDEISSATTKSVTLSLKQSSSSQTKGVSDGKEATEYAVIASANIYFIDDSDNNVFHRELTAGEITSITNAKATAGEKSITIAGVPSSATSLYFIANTKADNQPNFPNIEDLGTGNERLRIDKLQAEAVSVPMAGKSVGFTAGAGNVFTTTVEITPLVARLEIGKLTYVNQNGSGATAVGPDYTQYKLTGVYINNTRQAVLLSGKPYLDVASIDVRNQAAWNDDEAWPGYFASSNTKFPYYSGGFPSAPTGWVDNSMVTHCSPTTTGPIFYPDTNKGSGGTVPDVGTNDVWGYQICPSVTSGVGADADVPTLILKLSEIKDGTNLSADNFTQYITVENYKNSDGGRILEFKRGNVYRIANLEFNHSNASVKPYRSNISVTATVTVTPWTINNITPEF